MRWRSSLEGKFRFDPAKTIDRREIARVELEVLVERRKLEDRLRAGFTELKQIHAQILAARQYMKPQAEGAHTAFLQSEADLRAARGLR